MEYAFLAVLGYAFWMLVLLSMMLVVRARAIKAGVSYRTVIQPDNKGISDFAARLSRAHANCYENFPIFIAVVFVAYATKNMDIMQASAIVFLLARIGQSSVHLYSTHPRVTMVRGLFFGVQVALILYWMARLCLIEL